jgi:formylglycine-generating enzyme required for sulfatase activity
MPDSTTPREWRLVSGRHWQIVTPTGTGEPADVTDARENTRGSCGPGMVEVSGRMKQHFLLDELQMQACSKWIDRKWPERCGEYDRDKWLALSRELPTVPLHFCIDRFEYPNRKGEYPIILVNWYEARDACAANGKRLCTEDEWTFACEGEEARPYPNGYVRDPEACLNDRPWKQFHGEALSPRSGEAAMHELDRLWQGLPSGARPLCKSPFGAYDLTGNVDEWTRSSVPGERPSVLKGGYWGPVRTRCRPATKAHGEEHTFYQQGFRCCGDAP